MENIKMTEWKTVKIGDLGKIITGKTPSTKVTSYWGNDVPFVTPRDIQISRYIYMTEKLLSTDGMFSVRSSVLPKNAVCVSCIGNIGYVSLTLKECVSNQQINSIVVSDENDACFVYYLMKSLWGYFKKYEGQSTALSILNKSQFSNIDVNIPPLEIQRKIAGILGALDDRIDVLRRENVVLEQMAQAVFQSWFVDFDIVRAKAAGTPESEVCEKYHISPELYALFPSALTPDNLPLGWEKKTLEDMGMIVGGGTPSTENEKFFALAGTAVPWITPKDLSGYADKYISHGSIDISQEGLKHSSAKLMPQGTVLFSSRAPIGYCVIAEKPVSTNQGFKSITPNKREYIEYLYQFLKSNVSMISRYASGSTFKEVSGSVMKQIPILMPPEKLLFSFENMCFCFNAKNKNNSKQIRVLSATRDALLPQLLGGKIDVENVPLLSVNEEDILKN